MGICILNLYVVEIPGKSIIMSLMVLIQSLCDARIASLTQRLEPFVIFVIASIMIGNTLLIRWSSVRTARRVSKIYRTCDLSYVGDIKGNFSSSICKSDFAKGLAESSPPRKTIHLCCENEFCNVPSKIRCFQTCLKFISNCFSISHIYDCRKSPDI